MSTLSDVLLICFTILAMKLVCCLYIYVPVCHVCMHCAVLILLQIRSRVVSCARRLRRPALRLCCSSHLSSGRQPRPVRMTEQLLSWQFCHCWNAASRCWWNLWPTNGSVANVHCPGSPLLLLIDWLRCYVPLHTTKLGHFGDVLPSHVLE